jgi:ribosomal protein S18 acetylase RimI-like enzyme
VLQIRSWIRSDIPALLSLLAVDQLPTQPACTRQDLKLALTGQGTIDRPWWDTLKTVQTIVATRGQDIVGAASYGLQKHEAPEIIPADGSGYILWLHAREDPEVIEALLTAIEQALPPCPCLYAFWFATPLTLGLEGLPVTSRLMTHQALLAHGFTGQDDWLYLAGPLSPPFPPQTEPRAEVVATASGWMLLLREQGEILAEADISRGKGLIGHLRWLWVREDQRGRGLGTGIFRQACTQLYLAGARFMVIYVDHDDPAQRDRNAAIRLYQRSGFPVIDHLWSYWRGKRPG